MVGDIKAGSVNGVCVHANVSMCMQVCVCSWVARG